MRYGRHSSPDAKRARLALLVERRLALQEASPRRAAELEVELRRHEPPRPDPATKRSPQRWRMRWTPEAVRRFAAAEVIANPEPLSFYERPLTVTGARPVTAAA